MFPGGYLLSEGFSVDIPVRQQRTMNHGNLEDLTTCLGSTPPMVDQRKPAIAGGQIAVIGHKIKRPAELKLHHAVLLCTAVPEGTLVTCAQERHLVWQHDRQANAISAT
ncbi:hypothetical protein Bbelb_146860 [Branchiostoma belcheri]|nr:hypothetical protein Bbelb_146860 [Branchiostoma belcheri]